ncbi:MAG: carboxylesterase family protein [Planctomycetota bacterium]|jgi:dienelactone hydrolase
MRVFACLLLAAVAYGDVVYVKGAKKLIGRVVSEEGEVVVNPYNSRHPEMVLDVERVAASRVKKIVRTLPAPHHDFHRRLAEATDADALVEVAAWCAKNKLKDERRWALEKALRLEPDHEARKLLGSKAPKGNWPDQLRRAREFLADPSELPSLPAFSELYLRRALRSARQKKGEQADRPVALRADKLETGARYTLRVPESYDPLKPTPLVIGLHGGGRGGADGKLVVGDGWQAMSFYRHHAERRGWICACPTALQAGWGGSKNDALIDAMLDELCALFNIDENRIYLVGHSMGGGGTWVQGTRTPERWAAIAPAASYGPRGIDKLQKTLTGFYVYHSDDDQRTRVGPVRSAMRPLRGSGADFVYTELKGRGHAFPPEVIRDIFEYFDMRTLARGRGRMKRTVRPLSSFERKLSKDEKKYLPPLESGGEESTLSKLIRKLRTGGGVAQQVVPELVKLEDKKAGRAVARLMIKNGTESDVRRYCARILGERKEGVDALGKLLAIETDTNALVAALEALEAIADPAAGPDLLRFLSRRRAYLFERASSGRVDHSDWKTIVPPLALACTVTSKCSVKGGAAAIAKQVLDGVFLADIKVVFDRANQNPLPIGRALANAACAALRSFKDPAARPALERMRKKSGAASGAIVRSLGGPGAEISGWPQDPRIAAEVRSALSVIPTER